MSYTCLTYLLFGSRKARCDLLVVLGRLPVSTGSFLEADRLQRGQPVEIAASKAAVHALLDFVYGGQPEVTLEPGLELLRLAEAYDLPKLAGAIEAGFRFSLDSNTALQVLQETHGLHAFKSACEEKVAEDFETCILTQDFGKLSALQLARVLKREDLGVSREEAVLKGIWNWLKISNERNTFLGMLLQHVDFQSISVENLLRLGHFTLSGPHGGDMHREVDDALRVRQRKRNPSWSAWACNFRPKRRCLQHWSPDLGASAEAAGREVLPIPCISLCWHEGAIYAMNSHNDVLCWRLSEPATPARKIVDRGNTRVNIGPSRHLAVSPTGELYVADECDESLTRFQDGSGQVLLDHLGDDFTICCSPNGVLYVLNCMDDTLQKLVGSTFQLMMTGVTFYACRMFATKEEVIYGICAESNEVARINPADPSNPVVVLGQLRSDTDTEECGLGDLFVTEGGTIYLSDFVQKKVWAFRPDDASFTEVLECPNGLRPRAVLVQDRSLYVGMTDLHGNTGGLYQYLLPPELQLE